MKLISLNIEGDKHLDRVFSFLEEENADIICLVEALENTQDWLRDHDYFCSFATMCLKNKNGTTMPEGVIVATKLSHESEIIPYHLPHSEIVLFDTENKRETIRHLVLYFEVNNFRIGATHFTWNPVGEIADEYQKIDMTNMLSALNNKPSHILCGDFNIPRYHNELYEKLTERYTDNIPEEYNSSLDKNLHRLGSDPEMKKLFDDFVVDYLFTQEPYFASDTKLVFGISDHAAVVSNLEYMP